MSKIYEYVTGTSHLDATTKKYFSGLYISETNNSTAWVTVRSGSSTGTVVFDRRLAAYGSSDILVDGAVQFPDGIYVKVESGAVQLALLLS